MTLFERFIEVKAWSTSHSTWPLIRDEIGCHPKGQANLKGIPRPIDLDELEQA